MRQRRRNAHLLRGVVLSRHREHAANEERGVRKTQNPEGGHDRELAFPDCDSVWRAAERSEKRGSDVVADRDGNIMKCGLTFEA